jgi:hypothetical protein
MSTLTRNSRIEFRTRLLLGGVSGLIFAWFVSPQATNGGDLLNNHPAVVTSLSPLVLSFLAGYSIEVVFSMINRLVSSFEPEADRKISR